MDAIGLTDRTSARWIARPHASLSSTPGGALRAYRNLLRTPAAALLPAARLLRATATWCALGTLPTLTALRALGATLLPPLTTLLLALRSLGTAATSLLGLPSGSTTLGGVLVLRTPLGPIAIVLVPWQFEFAQHSVLRFLLGLLRSPIEKGRIRQRTAGRPRAGRAGRSRGNGRSTRIGTRVRRISGETGSRSCHGKDETQTAGFGES